jgi:hypothetical protein
MDEDGYKEILISFGEIVRVLKYRYPGTFNSVLTDIDLSNEAVDEHLDAIGMNTPDDE